MNNVNTMDGATLKNCIVSCEHLTKEYQIGPQQLRVLDDLNLQLHEGEIVAIVGSSGSGKSTLLNMLGGLDLPSSGKILVAGEDIARIDESTANRIRNEKLGFVYQFHHLLPEFTAEENVAMPLLIAGKGKVEAKQVAKEVLAKVGLGERLSHKPAELSGGERQRVAIARALVHSPALVLMDEPTGNLDKHTAEAIQALIFDLNSELKTSFLIVTHDPDFAKRANRQLLLDNGQLTEK